MDVVSELNQAALRGDSAKILVLLEGHSIHILNEQDNFGQVGA